MKTMSGPEIRMTCIMWQRREKAQVDRWTGGKLQLDRARFEIRKFKETTI
jgi:hypothetical protein